MYQFIVLELHGGAEYACICSNEDGTVKVFDNINDANEEAKDCQKGMVVRLVD